MEFSARVGSQAAVTNKSAQDEPLAQQRGAIVPLYYDASDRHASSQRGTLVTHRDGSVQPRCSRPSNAAMVVDSPCPSRVYATDLEANFPFNTGSGAKTSSTVQSLDQSSATYHTD